MSRDIPEIGRKFGSPNVAVPQIDGGEQLISALQQFQNAATTIGERSAIEQATVEGQLARESGAEVTIAPGINRVTAAFNKSYSDTDASIVTRAGIEQLQKAIAKNSDPRNLSFESHINFEAEAQGIIEGTMESALPQNRAAIQDTLSRFSLAGFNQVQGAVQKLEIAQLNQNYEDELNTALEIQDSALMSFDIDRIEFAQQYKADLEERWSNISAEISLRLPNDLKKLRDSGKIAYAIGAYNQALERGEEAEFLSDFSRNRPELYSEVQHLEAIAELNKLDKSINTAQSEQQATEKQNIINRINNPFDENRINNLDQLKSALDNSTLNGLQKSQVTGKWAESSKESFKFQAQVDDARVLIKGGLAGAVPTDVRNKMYETGLQNAQQILGRPAVLPERFALVEELGHEVPLFNKTLNALLENPDDLESIHAAGKLWSDITISKSTHLATLKPKQLALAERYTDIFNATGKVQDNTLVGLANSILRPDDNTISERNEAANASWAAKGNNIYKEVHGVTPDLIASQGIYRATEKVYKANRANSLDNDQAIRATRIQMRGYGTDQLFRNNAVARNAPSKVFVGSNGTLNIRNQYSKAIVDYVDEYNSSSFRQKGEPAMKILDVVDVPENPTEHDKLFHPYIYREGVGDIRSSDTSSLSTKRFDKKIRGEYKGRKGEFALESIDATLAVDGGGAVYLGIFEYDDGTWDILPQDNLFNGFLNITMHDIDKTAPNILREGKDETLQEQFQQTQDNIVNQLYDQILDETGGNILQKASKKFASSVFTELFRQSQKDKKPTIESLRKLRDVGTGNTGGSANE